MSVNLDPIKPDFRGSEWIASEDVNVEHLLDIFTAVDGNSDSVWGACANFMDHLYWHKKRLVILKPRIKSLQDDHGYKPLCLFYLSRLFSSVGNRVERRRLLIHALKLQRERGGGCWVAMMLVELSEANRFMGLHKEGIEVVKEALELFERLGDTAQQADCLINLAWSLCDDEQFDAAEEAAFRAVGILPEEGEQFRVCESHRALSEIYQSKGEIKKAILHSKVVLGIAFSFNWHDILFWAHYKLAGLFRSEGRLDDAQAHVEHAKSHTANSAYYLGYAMEEQASVWYKQHRLGESKSEALRAADIYDELGAAKDAERCRQLLQRIEKKLNTPVASGQSGLNCEFPRTVLFLASINFLF